MSDRSILEGRRSARRLRIAESEAREARRQGWLVEDPSRRRPRYFDGRFLTARDVARDQDYFLSRQADFARLGGGGVVVGLRVLRVDVDTVEPDIQPSATELSISRGHGVTPSGELLLVRDELTVDLADVAAIQRLDAAFGLEVQPNAPIRGRSGLFVLSLRYVEYTANPVASYPQSLQGERRIENGEVIEAAAVTLIPLEDVARADLGDGGRVRLAREIFLSDVAPSVPEDALPLAVVSLERGEIQWVDEHLVRRRVGIDGPHRSGRPSRASEALLQHHEAYVSELLQRRSRDSGSIHPPFAAADFLEVLPPCGTVPIDSLRIEGADDDDAQTIAQYFFPAEVDVRLALVPEDELPALIEEALPLPAIDLQTTSVELDNTEVLLLVPVPREGVDGDGFAQFIARLQGKLTLVPKARVTRRDARKSLFASLNAQRAERRVELSDEQLNPVLEPWKDALDLARARGRHLFFVRRRRLPQVPFASSRFQSFPPDSPDPSETLGAVARERLRAAGELEPNALDPNLKPRTSTFNFLMRRSLQEALVLTEDLLLRPGCREPAVVNGLVAELAHATRVQLDELIQSRTEREAIVDTSAGAIATVGSAPVRVRPLRVKDMSRAELRYARTSLGAGWARLRALEPELDSATIRQTIARALRVPELDATAQALGGERLRALARDLLAAGRDADLGAIKDLVDVRLGPTEGAPDEDRFQSVPGDPGSEVASRLGEGRAYRLVFDKAEEALQRRLSRLVDSEGFDQLPVLTPLLSQAVTRGWGVSVRNSQPERVDIVIDAVRRWDLGEDLDIGSIGTEPTTITNAGLVGRLLGEYEHEALELLGRRMSLSDLTQRLADAGSPLTRRDFQVIGIRGRGPEFLAAAFETPDDQLPEFLIAVKAATDGNQVPSFN